ncbi:hypothetical protein CHS0354_020691 [Potamilus streckersoni]|uniref:Uncharacterized protein n=1 Tax=Potamilus streckersoni TaxID=2493646 RepID=A0AAE0WBC5_9BIVA|nr:hypothetical protein CHS0354_020691 [Potamilus streckersoni]
MKVSEFKVKVSGDTYLCHISDILHLKNSRILLTDYKNSKIKMFGRDYKYQENMTLQGGPWSVCSLSYTKLAVTIPHSKTIQIIGITAKMLKVRDIRTRLQCWGIAVVKDQLDMTNATGVDTDREGNTYLGGYVSQCVQQISAEGKLIKTLISKKAEGKNPFMVRFYTDKDRFILTYGNSDTVEVYDLRV